MEFALSDIIEKLNKSWYLPTIQRDYVWLNNEKNKKVEKLFDSLMLGYPIGQIVLWKIFSDSELDKMNVYKFLDHFERDGKNENGSIPIINSNIDYLVLDGQQRLTSLYVSLSSNGYIQDGKDKKYLYMNLLYKAEKETVDEVTYQFEFLTETEANVVNENELWFRISDLMNERKLDKKDYTKLQKQALLEKLPDEQKDDDLKDYIKEILDLIWDNIREKKVNCEEVKNNSIDSLLEIFVRLNDGGIPLEKSDLLLSFMESNQSLFKPLGPRNAITSFVRDDINNRNCSIDEKVKIDKDTVLKTSLMLTDLPIQYRVQNFIKDNLTKIDKNWDLIQKIIKIVYKLLDRYNFTGKTLTSNNALLPIAYYIKVKKLGTDSFYNSNDKDKINERKKVIDWLTKVLVIKVFGGSSDNTLLQYRENIKKTKTLNVLGGRKFFKDDIKKMVDKAEYKGKYTLLFLFLVTDSDYWEQSQDHIFPQIEFEGELKNYKSKMNCIGNLQLLSKEQNSSKNAKPVDTWQEMITKDDKKANLYPENIELKNENFEKFINKRKEMIIDKICERLGINE